MAATYALIPVAVGAISAGRLGTAAAFVAIPVIGLLAGRMFSLPPRLARRAAWATGLAIAVGAAFVPLLWPIALLGAILAGLALRRRGRADLLRNLAIVVIVPPVLLIPWTFQLATHPRSCCWRSASRRRLASPTCPARSLLLLSPGGPGLPPVWVTVGLLVAALAALAVSRRRVLVLAGLDDGRAQPADRGPGEPGIGPAPRGWPGGRRVARRRARDQRGRAAARCGRGW